MTRSNRVGGLLLGGLGVAAISAARQLPEIPGQPIGPAVFPFAIGAVLCLCAVLIYFSVGEIVLDPDDADADSEAGQAQTPASHPVLGLVRLMLPPAALMGYFLLVDYLGFLITGFSVILVIAVLLGARWLSAVILSAVMVVLMDAIFAGVLRVPLPTGLLALSW